LNDVIAKNQFYVKLYLGNKMKGDKIFAITWGCIVGVLLIATVVFSIIKLNEKDQPVKSTSSGSSTVTMVSSPIKAPVVVPTTSMVPTAPPTPAVTQIPKKLYVVYEEDDCKYARSINFDDSTLQNMNVVDIAGIVEPSDGSQSYGLATLHTDRNGQNKIAVISNYNTDDAEYRSLDLIDSKGNQIRGMTRLTNVNTIMFGLANGLVYYFNTILDNWVQTPFRGIQNISGTSVSPNILANNTLYDVKVDGANLSFINPKPQTISRGSYRIYGPNPQIYADINAATGAAAVNLPNGVTQLKNVADISFIFDNNNVSTNVIYRNDQNFVRSKYILNDQLLIGRSMDRTVDMDCSDITFKIN
jgi:hypothetical protein